MSLALSSGISKPLKEESNSGSEYAFFEIQRLIHVFDPKVSWLSILSSGRFSFLFKKTDALGKKD